MAKLTDVNVLDMQGGKVTRVSYAGAEYVRTEDAAVAGDIVQRRHKYDTEYATGGEFYLAYNTGGMRVYDNDDDVEYHTEAWRTFRKQTATVTPDLTQLVDAIDARVSALEGAKQAPPRAFKVGDYAKVATGRARMYDLSGGEIFKLAFNDGCYDFRAHSVSRIVDELCDAADLEPASDAEVAHAKRAAKFTALGRAEGELREGDLVRVTRTKGSGDGIRVGQLLETIGDGDENSVGVFSGWRVAADLVAPAEARVDAN